MSKTEPIRDIQNIKKIKQFFKEKNKQRDYLLFTLGINTGLRISDILCLKYSDVIDYEKSKIKSHIIIREQKTGKVKSCFLNEMCVQAIEEYYALTKGAEDEYIFQSRKGSNQHITRQRAYSIIKEAACHIGLEEHISCHSLRKTFGYHAWKKGISPAVIMNLFNHSSMQTTRIYLCINQDDEDDAYRKIML